MFLAEQLLEVGVDVGRAHVPPAPTVAVREELVSPAPALLQLFDHGHEERVVDPVHLPHAGLRDVVEREHRPST